MKRLFIGLVACLVAAIGLSQDSNEKVDVSTEKNGGTITVISGNGVTPYSGTPVLGDLICFNGTNWVSLAAGTTGKFLQANTGACPTYETLPAAGGAVNLQASSPGTPDTGNWNITGIGTSTHDNIHATLTPGLFLSNTQAALVGQTQEYSPSLKLCGAGWNPTGGASESDCWQIFGRPIATNPTGMDIAFQRSLAGAAYAEKMVLDSSGKLSLGEATATNGQLRLYGATSGSITLTPPSGALGTKTLTLPAVDGTVLTDAAAITVAQGGTGLGTLTAHGVLIGEGTSNVATTSAGTAGQVLVSGGASADPTFANCVSSPTMVCIFDDFTLDLVSTGAAAAGTFFRCTGSGTGSGCNPPTLAPTANEVGIWELTTGTTTTGASETISNGAQSGGGGGLLVSGGETFQARIYIPTASVISPGNQFNTISGLCDSISNAACANGLYVSWDDAVDTHWKITAVKASAATTQTSNLVATAGAWHTIKIVVNADATSVAYYVDGSELNVSPLATNIPTTAKTAIMPLKLVSVASSTGKIGEVDYGWFTKKVSR